MEHVFAGRVCGLGIVLCGNVGQHGAYDVLKVPRHHLVTAQDGFWRAGYTAVEDGHGEVGVRPASMRSVMVYYGPNLSVLIYISAE